MFADDEQPPQIKVVDRRRFIQEGTEVHENPHAEPERPVAQAPEAAAPQSGGPPGSAAAQGETGRVSAAQAESRPAGGPQPDAHAGAQPGGAAGTQSATSVPGDAEKHRKDSAQRQADQAAAGLPPADFMTLTEFLAQQVATYLGEPDPMGRALEPNLPVAAMFIDLLGVLQEKTKGNLSLDESRLLDQLLYALRLQYVQRRR